MPLNDALIESQVLEFDPADCLPPEDNRPVNDDDLGELLESIRRDGQIVPGKTALHPTLPGKKLCVAGARRRRCCQLLGIAFRAEFIERVLTRPEIIRIRVGENVHRKNPSPFELCNDVSDYMRESGLSTWAEVAQELSLSPATVSRITSVKRIPPALRAKAQTVCPSVCWMVAALPDAGAMEQALDFATTRGPDGKLPTRDTVARCLARYKARADRTPRPKLLRGTVEGRKIELALTQDETADSLIKFLNGLIARLGKHKDVPAEHLGFLLNG